jgi:hypothetical protein
VIFSRAVLQMQHRSLVRDSSACQASGSEMGENHGVPHENTPNFTRALTVNIEARMRTPSVQTYLLSGEDQQPIEPHRPAADPKGRINVLGRQTASGCR